jgi:hypothetical protein
MRRLTPFLLILACSCASAGDETTDAALSPPADAGPDAAPFTPRSLDGLVIWLDGDVGVQSTGAQVVSWMDRSGNGNDATSGTDRPVVITGLVNGHAAVRFDGQMTFMQMPDVATTQWGTGDYAVVVVAAVRNAASTDVVHGYAMLYGKSSQTYPYAGAVLFMNWPIPSASTKAAAQADATHNAVGTTSGLNSGMFHLFAMRHHGTMLEVRVDGQAEAQADVTGVTADAPGAKPTIGGQAKIVQMLDGDIAEVVAVKGAVSDSDMAALEAFLKKKYAL